MDFYPTQYDIQLASGVLDTIEDAKYYCYAGGLEPHDPTMKLDYKYMQVVRNTIGWITNCDADGSTMPSR